MILYHKTKAKKMLKIWTDGSCLGNPGPGGWAFIATDGENIAERKELWQQLDELAQTRKIHWVWVRGHNGNTYNERCDELARTDAEKMK